MKSRPDPEMQKNVITCVFRSRLYSSLSVVEFGTYGLFMMLAGVWLRAENFADGNPS